MQYVPVLILLPMIVVFGFLIFTGHKQQDKEAVGILAVAAIVFIALPLLVFTTGG